ncbi:MAG: hypothetical protein GXP49_12930 [Deltaproteobacteria bacterium]|nr:hypothetical protein [Deltaproteobacteria bacterium]
MLRKILAGAGVGLVLILCAALPALLYSETTRATGRLERKDYSIDVTGSTVKAAQKAKISISIEAKGEYELHIHGAPFKITLVPPKGIELDKTTLTIKDSESKKAKAQRFTDWARSGKPGIYRVPVKLDFVLCSAKMCKPVQDETSVKLVFEGPGSSSK